MTDHVKRRKLSDSRSAFYPVLPDDLVQNTPLLEVYIASIKNVKDTSKIILELNSLLSIPELIHLKRIKGRDIILYPAKDMEISDMISKLREKKFDVTLLDNVRITLVAKIPPNIRSQYEIVNKIWPCNFHPNKYLEKLCTNNLFTSEEIDNHTLYMRLAIDVAEFAKKTHCQDRQVGTVIVDPKINSVVAVGFKISGPCRHSVMVAIDNVAKSQNGGVWNEICMVKEESFLCLKGFPCEILNILRTKYNKLSFGATVFKQQYDSMQSDEGPYLCTGYYAYITREPCIMCAMALIHSRIKRVFYGTKSLDGGLGTLCKIHAIKDLNHHYEVFGGLLEDVCKEI